jgi:hypothetical protein
VARTTRSTAARRGASDTTLFLAAILAAVFFSQSCGSILNGRFQKISVTSDPPGTVIFVDGKVVGEAPMELNLPRDGDHEIRIEKRGYRPAVISISQETSRNLAAAVAGDVVFGVGLGGSAGVMLGVALAGTGDSYGEFFHELGAGLVGGLIGAAAGAAILLLVDSKNGHWKDLAPARVQVTLVRAGGELRSTSIRLDASALSNLRWISVRCMDEPGLTPIRIR